MDKPVHTTPRTIIFVLVSTLLNGFAQVSYKFGANELFELPIYQNYYIILGIFLYLVSGLIMIYAFGHGQLSVLYPLVSAGFIWVNLLSAYFFQENIGPLKWLGITVIVMGITLIGRSKY